MDGDIALTTFGPLINAVLTCGKGGNHIQIKALKLSVEHLAEL